MYLFLAGSVGVHLIVFRQISFFNTLWKSFIVIVYFEERKKEKKPKVSSNYAYNIKTPLNFLIFIQYYYYFLFHCNNIMKTLNGFMINSFEQHAVNGRQINI